MPSAAVIGAGICSPHDNSVGIWVAPRSIRWEIATGMTMRQHWRDFCPTAMPSNLPHNPLWGSFRASAASDKKTQ